MNAPPAGRPDVIVVLGCQLRYGASPTGAVVRRAEAAARAFHAFGPRSVIASGGRRWDGTVEADFLSSLLVSHGVPNRVIVRELCSLTTVENAWYVAEILREARSVRPALVTCDWHMPRALSCFERVGVPVMPLPAIGPVPSPPARIARNVLERARFFLDRRTVRYWTET